MDLVQAGDPGATPEPQDSSEEDAPNSESQELLALVAAGAARGGNKFIRRSWEHIANARAGKKAKREQKQAEAAASDDKAMSTALAAVSHLHRGLHQLAQKHSKAVVPATTKARAVALFAFAPSIKGNLSGRFRQWRGASVSAQHVMCIQREWLQSQLAQVGGASPDVSSDVLPSGVSPIVRVFTWQWDETSQRIRALLEKVMTNEKKSHQKVGVQVMMQHGVCRQFSFERNECTLVSADEWFARGLQLAEQSAEFILEGLSRGMPFFVDDISQIRTMFGSTSCVVLSFCCDRASANFRALAWIWKQLASPAIGHLILPHVEPCALHGVQLVKCKPRFGKQMISAASTLAACMRQWRFAHGLRDTIITHVKIVFQF